MRVFGWTIFMAGLACGVLLFSGVAMPPARGAKEDGQTVHYVSSAADFPNPERGFHKNTELLPPHDLRWVRTQGYSLVRAYVRMDTFREKPLSADYLHQLDAGFAKVREAGVKVLPIFAYNFPTDADIKAGGLQNIPDAPLDVVLEHLRQLKPVLARNADVIAALEIGFVGAWGEWHSSKNDLDTPENKALIHRAILAALPRTRMMQLRYPADLMRLYPAPLEAKQAFSGSEQARTGFANMCFLSNESDSGTYFPLDTKAEKQTYVEQMTRYVIVGGETCQITPDKNRTDCVTAQAELSRFHFSYLNLDFYTPTIERWRKDGCLEAIAKRLGYRFRLQEAVLPRQIRAGQSLRARLSILNDGWASPYNPRNVELVLRNKTMGRVYAFPLRADPRRWFPGTEPYPVESIVPIPRDAAAGEYECLLNLPDPMPALAARPEYSIRLANEEVWEADTGYNRLLASLTIMR